MEKRKKMNPNERIIEMVRRGSVEREKRKKMLGGRGKRRKKEEREGRQ